MTNDAIMLISSDKISIDNIHRLKCITFVIISLHVLNALRSTNISFWCAKCGQN